MMPFYYGSRARSVPEYLKLRFDEKTRGLNAISFAVMTVFSSGISLYALAKLLEVILKWDFDISIWIAAGIVMIYTFLGGLTSAVYNEVLQFFLIVLGLSPLVIVALHDIPYSGDELLFEILHFDWFHNPSIEIAKLSIEASRKKFDDDSTSLRRLLYEKAKAPPKDLFSQGLHDGLKKASAILEQLISDVPNITLQMLFENVVRKAGILNYIM